MINLFRFAEDDKSLQYLAQIFGYMNGVIPIPNAVSGITTPTGVSPSGTSLSLFGSMFQTFNGVILVIGALIVVYTTIVGIIGTAHEGEFMGKKFNNIWIPIRTVIGIAALVPTGSGYSGIQIIMMWVIVQGIGAADVLWDTVLSHIDLFGSPYASVTIPSVGIYQSSNLLFRGLVCDRSARMTVDDPSGISGGGYFCKSGDSWCRSSAAFNPQQGSTTYRLGPGGQCGVLTFCNSTTACTTQPAEQIVGALTGSLESTSGPNSLKCLSCQGQRTALQAVIPTLSRVAERFVLADYQYRDFYANSYNRLDNPSWGWIKNYCRAKSIPNDQCCIPRETDSGPEEPVCKARVTDTSPFPSPISADGNPQGPSDRAVNELYWPYAIASEFGTDDFIATAVNEYKEVLTRIVSEYVSARAAEGRAMRNPQLEAASRPGWILAGSYYYTLANMNSKNLEDAMPTLQMELLEPSATGHIMAAYRNNVTAASVLANAAGGQTSAAYAAMPQASAFGSALGTSGSSIKEAITENASNEGGTNPLIALTVVGTLLLTIAELLFAVAMTVTIAVGITGNLSVFGLGTGFVNPLGGTAILLYMVFVPLALGLFGLMVTIGGTLGIYVPLIPYVIFTFGAIGWLISTIEAMVAGPLVALGILSPSGQHEIMGKSGPALMLLFNIFLRPSLMIFGLVAAMLLATVVVTMINAAFFTVMVGVGTVSGILAWIIWLTAYVTLVISALNKCFAAIHVIPEKVMRWIEGGQGEQYGEGEALGEMKGGVGAATGGMKSAGGQVESTGAKVGKLKKGQQKELEEQQNPDITEGDKSKKK